MVILMSGLDYSQAPIELREQLSYQGAGGSAGGADPEPRIYGFWVVRSSPPAIVRSSISRAPQRAI